MTSHAPPRAGGVRLTPARALGMALALAGAGVLVANRSWPDESRWLGVLVLAVGAVLGVAPETARRRGALQLLASTCLVLLGGEMAVRRENARAQAAFADRLIHFVDDADLRFELKASVPCGLTSTNDLGMVDVSRAVSKPEGTVRIACLGDSVGADCSLPGENVCAALETILRERRAGRPTEGLNFSVFGYNTLQEARSLELKAAAFRPDAVVVLYVLNDPFPELALSHHLLGHFKFEHLLFSGARLAAARAVGGTLEPLPEIRRLYGDPAAWQGVVVAGFDRIARVAQNLGAPVAVAVFPIFSDPPASSYSDVYAKVVDEARRHGFVGLDLSRVAFAGVPAGSLLKPSRDAIHPNALAHRLAAQAIADALGAAAPGLLER